MKALSSGELLQADHLADIPALLAIPLSLFGAGSWWLEVFKFNKTFLD